MTRGRRSVLAGSGGIIATALAGCLSEPDRQDRDDAVYTSFFTLQEFTSAIVADRSVETAVPVGSHGHGWEPPASLLPEITDTAAFVYLGAEGFQHWVDDTLPELESEYSDEVLLIDALEGIDLLEYDGDGHGHGYDADDYELAVRSVHLFDPDGDELADAHGDHWHGTPIAVRAETDRSLTVEVRDANGDPIQFGEEYHLDTRVVGGESELVDIDTESDHADRMTLTARGDGYVELAIRIRTDDGVVFEAPPLKTEIGDHSHDHGDHSHDHGDHDHSHGEYDAKFFSDPVLAQRGIERIRDGLIELDPDNEETYTANADAYIDELAALHRTYQQRLADRDHDAVVLAGHDSFQYLSERYGFEIHTPVGLSPDEEPAESAIAETLEFIEDRGIEYVLWDYFDGDRLAESIADEASTVEETVMVSPAESTTETWLDEGYGDYLGQMREINLPALEKALGAT